MRSAESHPGAFLPSLATGLNNLSIRMVDLVRRDEAPEAITESAALGEGSAEMSSLSAMRAWNRFQQSDELPPSRARYSVDRPTPRSLAIVVAAWPRLRRARAAARTSSLTARGPAACAATLQKPAFRLGGKRHGASSWMRAVSVRSRSTSWPVKGWRRQATRMRPFSALRSGSCHQPQSSCEWPIAQVRLEGTAG